MKISFRPEFLTAGLIAIIISIASSIATYQIVMRKIPKIAIVDLAYLNNEFTVNLARYLADHHVSDEKMTEVVKAYISNLETLLKDINQSGNYVLLQKQTVVSDGMPDITKDLEKLLFERVMKQANPQINSREGGQEHSQETSQENPRLKSGIVEEVE